MVFKLSGERWALVGLLGLAALVGLSACGGSSAPASAPGGKTGTTTGAAQEIKVEMGDFFYKPSNITAKAGKVTFVLTNVGATAHRFSIKTGDTVKWTSKNVGAGRESTLELELPPGSYNLGCTLGDHEKRGSVGTLTVQ